ncbi:MAG: tRNA guanosine(34) transglycosylase Tgt [Nitrospira sp.]|nr:tRNA guanosine(34) transglycosylase Tgt [Nitrospira sp.]
MRIVIAFSVDQQDPRCAARAAVLSTPHGAVDTPAFMPVGTLGTVKGMAPDELRELGFGLMLSNAYHLYLRPGHRLIQEQGGLHGFTAWNGAILTDSGGFQLVSLADLRKITDDGISFRSHLDGSLHHLTPELCMEIQMALGSDVMMTLDECPPHPCSNEQAMIAVTRTTAWAKRCAVAARDRRQALFGIVQGALDADLRRQSARELVEIGFDGYAIGGLSLGEDKPALLSMLEVSVDELPPSRPRYLMGVGLPEDLVEGVMRGVDMFDCVIPSRHGRTGWLFTTQGRVLIKHAQYAKDNGPIDTQCECPVCRKYSRAYLRHLYLSNEMLGVRLNTIHNLWYYRTLMDAMRSAIQDGIFPAFRRAFYEQRREYEKSAAHAELAGATVVAEGSTSGKDG